MKEFRFPFLILMRLIHKLNHPFYNWLQRSSFMEVFCTLSRNCMRMIDCWRWKKWSSFKECWDCWWKRSCDVLVVDFQLHFGWEMTSTSKFYGGFWGRKKSSDRAFTSSSFFALFNPKWYFFIYSLSLMSKNNKVAKTQKINPTAKPAPKK